MPEYLIEAVGTPREWGNDFGRFFAYPLTLQGEAGEIEWSRKQESRAPVPGERIVGDITNGQHGRKIKVDLNATKELSGGSSGGGSRGGPAKSREYKPEHEFDPAKTARIGRSHAQEMALRLFAINEPHPSTSKQITVADVLAIADEFQADVEAAAKAAQGAGGVGTGAESPPGSREASPAPAQEIQSNAEYLSRLLEEAGFDSAAWPLIQRYIEETFDNDRRTKVEAALKDPAQRDRAKAVLVSEVEKWSGKPLPVADPDEEIPF